MRALIVGAGAVGQVYAAHLQRGGAQVSVFVKPKYAAEARRGFPMHRYRLLGADEDYTFHPEHVITSPEEAGRHAWDQVWFCTSATALRAGTWVDDLLPHLKEALIVNTTPGMQDRAWLLERLPEHRLVSGLITMIAYQAPLPGEDRAPCVAYLLPPAAPNVYSGPGGIAAPVVQALLRGGCPAREVESAPRQAGFGSAVMMSHIAALQLDDWDLERYRTGPTLARAHAVSQEYVQIAAAYNQATPPGALGLLSPALMRLALGLAPQVMPFDLEVYIRYHFTKVGDQTRAMLAMNIQWGRERGLPTQAMQALLDDLLARDAARAQAPAEHP